EPPRGERLVGALAAGHPAQPVRGERLAGLGQPWHTRDQVEVDAPDDDDTRHGGKITAVTSMWGAPLRDRWRGGRDPRQARFLTLASLRWVIRHRAYTPWYLVRYARLLRFRLANP